MRTAPRPSCRGRSSSATSQAKSWLCRIPIEPSFWLRFYDGLKPEAIAKDRGIPAATVRTQLRRGLQKLRDELTAEQDGNVNAWVVALLPIYRTPDNGPLGEVCSLQWLRELWGWESWRPPWFGGWGVKRNETLLICSVRVPGLPR